MYQLRLKQTEERGVCFFSSRIMPAWEEERWWSVMNVKSEGLYTFSAYFGGLYLSSARLWSSGPASVVPSLREIPRSTIFGLLLSLNQSSRLASVSDRRRTLSGSWWKLREMYMCPHWLISVVNIPQGWGVLLVRAQRHEQSCWSTILHNDCLYSGSWSMVEISAQMQQIR